MFSLHSKKLNLVMEYKVEVTSNEQSFETGVHAFASTRENSHSTGPNDIFQQSMVQMNQLIQICWLYRNQIMRAFMFVIRFVY